MDRTFSSANGTQTHFTFFSDFNNKVALTILETVVMSSIFIISIVANISAIILMAKKKKLVTANCFVLNLFCADLLFISMIPVILVIRWTKVWVLGEFICHMHFYIICLSGCVTLISLSAVSLERMISIMKVTQATSCNVKVVVCGLLGIWVFSAFTALPMCLFFNVVEQTVNGTVIRICTLVWPNVSEEIAWDISFIILNFLIPGLIIVVSYTKIYKITKSVSDRLISCENNQFKVSHRDYKLFRTLLILMISFFIMWTPVVIVVLLLLLQNLHRQITIPPTVFFWITTLTFSNSVLNPILYNINLFRQKWVHIILCHSVEESADTETTTKRKENPNISHGTF
ncbi:free fatty acid receptor 4-like [Xenopus laevis]|uniref:Free fatty acid receptor 4-like n=2 Tax=Xenopus laevis TaxID=8355 RepID=A0A1L8FEV9_XENLA|nr:free fatty acid receptor 4-like [Xenopus laevis]OCT70123.1 hypothetical protein XELAEV_18037045mg [Xenopus laevis]